jgi:hypothetical protein
MEITRRKSICRAVSERQKSSVEGSPEQGRSHAQGNKGHGPGRNHDFSLLSIEKQIGPGRSACMAELSHRWLARPTERRLVLHRPPLSSLASLVARARRHENGHRARLPPPPNDLHGYNPAWSPLPALCPTMCHATRRHPTWPPPPDSAPPRRAAVGRHRHVRLGTAPSPLLHLPEIPTHATPPRPCSAATRHLSSCGSSQALTR